ncbi:MAG: hypothetical protein O3B75_02755 [Planctomycetota bacterium]|nr:hypothetical protein [Planctomycetota bacterium]
MSAFPINDWQFWIATIVVIIALTFVIRPLLPRRGKSPACPNCPTDSVKGNTEPKRTELTMEGTKIRPHS